MKTNIRNQKTTVKVLALSVILIATAACGTKTGTSSDTSSSTEKTAVKAPTVDMHTAVFMNNVKAVKQYISAGSNLNKRDQYGSLPLTVAATFDRKEIAKLLIDGGADLAATSADGSTPLHTAAFFCRKEIVKMLLDSGSDKSIKNSYGSTPFESVAGPFEQVKPIYEQLNKDMGPFGLKLDYEELEATRPVIAEMLK